MVSNWWWFLYINQFLYHSFLSFSSFALLFCQQIRSRAGSRQHQAAVVISLNKTLSVRYLLYNLVCNGLGLDGLDVVVDCLVLEFVT